MQFRRFLGLTAVAVLSHPLLSLAQFFPVDSVNISTTGTPSLTSLTSPLPCAFPEHEGAKLVQDVTQVFKLDGTSTATLKGFKGTDVWLIVVNVPEDQTTCDDDGSWVRLEVDGGGFLQYGRGIVTPPSVIKAQCTVPVSPGDLDPDEEHTIKVSTNCDLLFAGFLVLDKTVGNDSSRTGAAQAGSARMSLLAALSPVLFVPFALGL
ncbi:hypothetical protein EXIGLDRAFT_725593 [Exidia glandulosa HHB12029]|uniref:Uncharacterized protein n=1 Tax=Exidia glandulosa HHB12029 TaxID=1314781 RepID=A0A165DYI6_EXIGL|nr:hypothetical protein EXIGLDRAFT_725593 [Exidia glandulosa HHB12029]